MPLSLGPMPTGVCSVISQLVAEAQRQPRDVDSRTNGLPLFGGPSGYSFLDANGEVWSLSFLDGEICTIVDGPVKVGMIAVACERIPDLTEWLPRRPIAATDCQLCHTTGWLQPPFPRVQCMECYGLGWSSE